MPTIEWELTGDTAHDWREIQRAKAECKAALKELRSRPQRSRRKQREAIALEDLKPGMAIRVEGVAGKFKFKGFADNGQSFDASGGRPGYEAARTFPITKDIYAAE